MVVDVDRIADLSKLYIPQDKKQEFEKQMNDMIAMTDVLSQIDDDVIENDNSFAPLREDTVQQSSITQNEIMRNAPCYENGCFCVPKTVE